MVSGFAMPRSKKTGATCAKTRRKLFKRAVRKFAKSGKVLRALLSAEEGTVTLIKRNSNSRESEVRSNDSLPERREPKPHMEM